MIAEKIITEARARIIWGDSVESVRDYLVSNGVANAEADAKVAELNWERMRELKWVGFWNLLAGILLTAVSGLTIWFAMTHFSTTPGRRSWVPFVWRVVPLALIAGIYGLWKLVTGIVYLIRPQSEHRSIPDIEGSDI